MAVRRLTEAAQADRDAFERLGDRLGCSCHISPPCTVCTHPGNPLNQEDEEFWEEEFTKDEALWYAICQMRRAARTLDIASIMTRDVNYREIYGKGLDMCADECEKVIDPTELRKMKVETFPTSCPTCARSGEAREENETGGVNICYDPWHEDIKA
jgi:hypothetical protein